MDKIDELVREIEAKGYQWDVSHTARLIEARIWDWPDVIGRCRPDTLEPAYVMLYAACVDAGIEIEEEKQTE